MTSQQHADRLLAEHWAERDQKEREAKQRAPRRVVQVGDHSPEPVRENAREAAVNAWNTRAASQPDREAVKEFIASASFASRSSLDSDTIFCEIYTPGYQPAKKGSFGFFVKELRAILSLLSGADGGADTKSDGGVESRHAETGNKSGAAPEAEQSSSATSFVRASGPEDKTSKPRAGVTPGPSDQLTKTPSADHDAGNLRGWSALFVECHRCGGSGFSSPGTGYGDVCSECGGLRFLPFEAAGKRPVPSVSGNIHREQQRNTMGVTAGETAPNAVADTDANAPGDTSLVSGASAEPNHQPHAVSQEEARIDTLRLKAFKTNDPNDRQTYFDATSKWFQDRHYRRMGKTGGAG